MSVIFHLSPGLEWIEPLMYLDKAQYSFMKMVVNGKRKIDIYFSRIWSQEREDLNSFSMLKWREQQKKRNERYQKYRDALWRQRKWDSKLR